MGVGGSYQLSYIHMPLNREREEREERRMILNIGRMLTPRLPFVAKFKLLTPQQGKGYLEKFL